MTRILVRWLISAVPVLIIVSAVTFVLTSLIPGNVGRTILGGTASQAQVDALNKQLGIDRPPLVRYADWLVSAVHGNLGNSLTTQEPVIQEIGERIGVTLTLIVGAVIVATILGVLLGTLSAIKGGWLRTVVDVISVLGIAVPAFWFGLVLVTLFAVLLPIFPATGWTAPTDSIGGWLAGVVLPIVTLAVPAAAPIAKQTRDGMLHAVGQEYVRVLRARGIPERSILFRHMLRNAAAPVITVVGIVAVVLLGGTVLVETVFVLPGMGGLAVSATATGDITTIQGIAVVFTLVVMLVNLIIEFLYVAVNPKVRS